MKLVLVSDTHLGSHNGNAVGADPRARLSACIDDVCARHTDAALMVLMGDVADAGEKKAYAECAELLKRLPMPAIALPGNRDSRHFLAQLAPWTPLQGGFVQGYIDVDIGRLIFVDTLDPGLSGGHLCDSRLAWIEETLCSARGVPVWMFMHHPPCPLGVAAMDALGLGNADRLAPILARHGSVRHIFCGHYHRSVQSSWNGIAVSVVPSVAFALALDLSGKARFALSDEPPAYAVALVMANGAVVHLEYFAHRSGEQVLAELLVEPSA